jgi:hypothetical protein
VVNALLEPGQAVRDGAYSAFTELNVEYARFVPWFPYPRLVVPELRAPTSTSTSWNFELVDPAVIDFLTATIGRKPIINFSTTPSWMWNATQPPIPDNASEPFFSYNVGTELNDPTARQVGEYFARVVSWYTLGGFTDELGQFHESGYTYDLPFWEVLNEVEFEHNISPEMYVTMYDAIVQAIHEVSPDTQFVGLALGQPTAGTDYVEYFLNSTNHAANIPTDWISYHFYAQPRSGETENDWQFTFFSQADTFLETVAGIETVREKLSPHTRSMLNEIGVILPSDNGNPEFDIPDIYWNAAGALYAYVYIGVANLGLNGTVGESQLVGYPTQYPSVTLIDPSTAKPNARYRVLQLITSNIGVGDEIIDASNSPVTHLPVNVTALSYHRSSIGLEVTKVFLVNHLNSNQTVAIQACGGGCNVEIVDLKSAGGPIRRENSGSAEITLGPFAVAFVNLPA